MSGFEVAGLVLGALPLAISALEHYRDGLRAIQRWRKYERELQSLIRNLETERAKLQNVCEMLLTGLVSHSRIEAMVDHPLGDLWLEEGIRKKVRMRLWRSWNVFEKTLQDMNVAIDRLMNALGDTTRVNVRICGRLYFAELTGVYHSEPQGQWPIHRQGAEESHFCTR